MGGLGGRRPRPGGRRGRGNWWFGRDSAAAAEGNGRRAGASTEGEGQDDEPADEGDGRRERQDGGAAEEAAEGIGHLGGEARGDEAGGDGQAERAEAEDGES